MALGEHSIAWPRVSSLQCIRVRVGCIERIMFHRNNCSSIRYIYDKCNCNIDEILLLTVTFCIAFSISDSIVKIYNLGDRHASATHRRIPEIGKIGEPRGGLRFLAPSLLY